MKPRVLAAVATAGAALALGGGGSSAASSPTNLGVRGVEYDLTLSRASIAPGQSNVWFKNDGQDAHNLVIKRVGGGKAHDSGKPTDAGQVDELHVTFRKGAKYVLFCSLKHHRAKGMEVHLQVKG
jgi:plastocyanin